MNNFHTKLLSLKKVKISEISKPFYVRAILRVIKITKFRKMTIFKYLHAKSHEELSFKTNVAVKKLEI